MCSGDQSVSEGVETKLNLKQHNVIIHHEITDQNHFYGAMSDKLFVCIYSSCVTLCGRW